MARGKDGYRRNKYKFGWSFFPERHTIESLTILAAVEGYSFLAGLFNRNHPKVYGRTDVNTARITENFVETHIIPLDDDGEEDDALIYWHNNKFFRTYGGSLYHSCNSTPERPRLRLIFELDLPIRSAKYYQLARRALGWYYPRIDTLPQVPQVWYGSEYPTGYEVFGKILPREVLIRKIITPYLVYTEQETLAKREMQARYLNQEKTDGDIIRIIHWLSKRTHGDNRNLSLLWASSELKRLGCTWESVGQSIISACVVNGYYQKYAGDEREIERIFRKAK